ncbi:cap methyltransferase 2 [Arctopsyche grandis]|uniref:cap methyltransferase 2 n=1 Tax=Arctopsyche grandis TaxID=121162 RepID=UPI00406D7F53
MLIHHLDSMADNVFSKKCTLSATKEFKLPDSSDIFASEPWQEERFCIWKECLNAQKRQLNNYDLSQWQQHTYKTNLAKEIIKMIKSSIRPELFTVAWTKFYECTYNYNTIPEKAKRAKSFNSLHLCEAPGAAITSLNHFIKSNHPDLKWNWRASTLNPYYEGNSTSYMICDDRFIKNTLGYWDFGANYSGDLMNWNNSQNIINNAREMGDVHLVTADGSIDCSCKPDEQESTVASLHFCEVITALQVLCEGGSFVLKMFTLYEHTSINLIYLLVNCFNTVNLFKPVSSKPGNSEIYIICLKYHGINSIEPFFDKFKEHYGDNDFLSKSMFPQDKIPKIFLEDLLKASSIFYSFQCEAIDNNIKIFEDSRSQYKIFKHLHKLQRFVMHTFMKQAHLSPITEEKKICKDHLYVDTNKIVQYHSSEGRYGSKMGTFEERVNSYETLTERKLLKYRDDTFKIGELLTDLPLFIDCNCLEKKPCTIIYGAPIENVKNSRFVSVQIFKMYTEMYDDVQKNCAPTTLKKINKGHLIEFGEYCKESNFDKWEKSSVNALRDTIISMDIGDTLVLKNYSTLTLFSVGVLYLLGVYAFDKIIFTKDFNIELIYLKSKTEVVSMLNDLCLKISKYMSPEMHYGKFHAILGIVPLKLLLSDYYFSNIYDYNNQLLLTKVNLKINKMCERSFIE